MNYEKEKEKAKAYATKQYYKQKIKELKHKYDKPKKPLSYSKAALIFIFINCTCIEIYSMAVMFLLQDLSALSTLIAAVVTESVSFAIYSGKSALENRQGGITYEMVMKNDNEIKQEFYQNEEVG